MLKVLFVGTSTLPIPAIKGGAIETLVTALLKENERCAKYSFHVISCSMGKNDEEKKYAKTIFYYYKSNLFYVIHDIIQKAIRKVIGWDHFSTQYGKYAIRIIHAVKPDIVIIEATTNEAYQICNAFRHSKGIKIVYHVHADYLDSSIYGIDVIKEAVDCYLSVSSFIGNQLIDKLGISDEKIIVLKNATAITEQDIEKKSIIRQTIRDHLHINNSQTVFVYCGRLSPEKGCLQLIKAFRNASYDAVLIIIGGSSFSSNKKTKYVVELENEAKSCRNRVIFIGYVPNNEAVNYFFASDVGVVPSVCNEAASLSTIEFRSSGLATIVSNVGGIPEYTNKDTSLFVDVCVENVDSLSSKLNELASNRILLNNLSSHSRDNISEFCYHNYYINFSHAIDIVTRIERTGKR